MSKFKKITGKIKEYCPRAVLWFFAAAAVAGILHICFLCSESFSDFYNRYIGAFIRMILAKITGILPFSLAETILMLIPLIITVLVVVIIKTSKKDMRAMTRLACSLLAALSFFYTSFTLTFAAGYKGTTLDDKLGLEQSKVSAEELEYTARQLLEKINTLVDEIDYKYGSFSIMPYKVSQMSVKLNEACAAAANKYDFLPSFKSNVKSVILSEPMTYTHISGVYTYFTGESNLNINFPDYTLPYTAAHELSHQRGIAREDEANFVAFLICAESEDPYIQYSGYLNLYEYVASALYKADSDLYYSVLADVDMRVRYEMIAYNDFFDKYRENVAAKVSGTINDNYLKIQGQSQGSKSYGMVVDLAVAYYK